MKFSISRELLLKPLQLVAGVVERRQTLPVLSNILFKLRGSELTMTATDLEVELVARLSLDSPGQDGEATIPARKLVDICRSLPEASNIGFSFENQRVVIRSGKSRFALATLPAADFPSVENSASALEFVIKQDDLRRLIDRTSFSMAQQDVRYYLNGMLFELKGDSIRAVATDGHRLALCTSQVEAPFQSIHHAIIPRKGVIELRRLLGEDGGDVRLTLGANHVRANLADFVFTSKLVDGKFPDYDKVLPKGGNKWVIGEKEQLRQAFGRAAILSNEKYRGVRLMLSSGLLTVVANNPEQEEAEEQIAVEYGGEPLEVGFNVNYLQDVLVALGGQKVKLTLSDANSSMLIEDAGDGQALYVVMPMRL